MGLGQVVGRARDKVQNRVGQGTWADRVGHRTWAELKKVGPIPTQMDLGR